MLCSAIIYRYHYHHHPGPLNSSIGRRILGIITNAGKPNPAEMLSYISQALIVAHPEQFPDLVVLTGDPNCGDGGKDNFNCDEVHGGAGCNDGVCEAAVCNIDPVCCESVWDQACVNLALSNCKTP